MPQSNDEFAAYYQSAEVELHQVEDAVLAVRRFGSGPPVVFVHGFPTHGYTWRFLLPELARKFTCYTVDLAGLGDSIWTSSTDFGFTAQGRRVARLLGMLGIGECALVAQDTGATVARVAALLLPEMVRGQVLINTEMPGHRPPWIPLYCMAARIPGAWATFRLLLGSSRYCRSGMGFGEFYSDLRLFDDPTRLGPYVEPLRTSRERLGGMLQYLAWVDWKVVDDMRDRHAELSGPTLLVWGEDDATFPIAYAERMLPQFQGRASLVRIPRASLMPHEERPSAVLGAVLPFLGGVLSVDSDG